MIDKLVNLGTLNFMVKKKHFTQKIIIEAMNNLKFSFSNLVFPSKYNLSTLYLRQT